MRVLIVEDDRKIASFTSRGLREEGFVVDVAEDGETGLAAALTGTHDLILLDIRLPGRDGVEVVKEIRRAGMKIPVILLTAAISVPDKVRGLDAGADDYLTKPFAFDELMARMRAVLRRQAIPEAGGARLGFGGIEADLHTQTVSREGRRLDLTARDRQRTREGHDVRDDFTGWLRAETLISKIRKESSLHHRPANCA